MGARPALARDQALLQPQPETQTSLPDSHWEGMRRALAARGLFLLLSVFEHDRDFDGAMSDLVVAVTHSPWMLKVLSPRHVQRFLQRIALVPTTFNSLQSLVVRGG